MKRQWVQPLVAVIVPVYNVEKYLVRCLDSVVNQTYQNLEIILVNDGSTDGSGEICRRYAESDERVRLFAQENQGQAVARNVGLDHADGEYIVFVDSDDYISAQLVEILLDASMRHNVPIAVCNHMCVEDSENHAKLDVAPDYIEGLCRKITRDDVFDTLATKKEFPFLSPCWKIYCKDIFQQLRYPPGKVHEDAYIFHKIYAQVDELCYVDLKLYAYRQSPNSTMRKNGVTESHADIVDALWERLLFFYGYGVNRYCCATGKKLLEDFAASADISDKKGIQEKKKELEASIYAMTGSKCYSAKYILFKISPALHRSVRKHYRKLRKISEFLGWKKQ